MAETNLADTNTADTNVAETHSQPAQKTSQELSALAIEHLKNLLQLAGFDAEASQESFANDTLTLAVSGPDATMLIGPQGQTLDAFQYLLMLMTNRGQQTRLRVTVDADGHRARRARKLSDFAQELAAEVGKTGQEAVTDSLNPMERRIIHTALADHPDVQTYSEGHEPQRYVVVTPRRN